jgi:malectin (di-glucose binding ER protein)
MEQISGEQRLQSVIQKIDAERLEVDLLLNSKTFARTNNLGRFLGFICEKYFEGTTSEIKEYSIAVQALGRPADFDPQLDTVVRVTAHNLRKRLEFYYSTEGADHPVHVYLPPGHYIPQFVHQEALTARSSSRVTSAQHRPDLTPELDASDSSVPQPTLTTTPGQVSSGRGGAKVAQKLRTATGIFLALVLISAPVVYYLMSRRSREKEAPDRVAAITAALSGAGIHALVGSGREPFVDRAGIPWRADRFCSGGTSFSVKDHTILGTNDPEIFSSGIRGAFHCSYPVQPGTYEVRLLFAETSGLQENSRNVGFSINGGPLTNLDVVDDAGGDDIATTKVFTDVAPASDGTIHVDFVTPEAFVNAIEILQGTPHRMLPVRIVAGHFPYTDSDGNVWMPETYFFGGRLSSFGGGLSKVPDGRLYEWHRFGHFHYVVPVAMGGKYTLKLHFREHWFGVQNGGIGGVGSRVFDVSCNGSMLLRGFDISREAGSEPLVKSFQHIEPTPQGKIEIYFTPAVNYPSISAIEIIPE